MARVVDELDADLRAALLRLTADLEADDHIVQPRCRHRYQADHHGLARTHVRLCGEASNPEFEIEGMATSLQLALGAVYAARSLAAAARRSTFEMVWRAMGWHGPVGPALFAHLTASHREAWLAPLDDPRVWACELLGFDRDEQLPSSREIQRRFRQLLRLAHPDHGGSSDGAAQRISELTDARRVLLG